MAYFTVEEARSVNPLGNATKYTGARIEEVRAAVEQALERACGVAFEPRVAAETFDGTGTRDLLLRPRPLSVESGTIDGLALMDVASLALYVDGTAYRSAGWPVGRGNITLLYRHGYAVVPGQVKAAALALTKQWLVDSPVDQRAQKVDAGDGSTATLDTDGPFGLPIADQVVESYGVRFGIA